MLWASLRFLFEEDDGLLPDIWVLGLSNEQLIALYEWVMTKATIWGEPTAWHHQRAQDVLLAELYAVPER